MAATDQNDGKASYSNYGSYDRVAAPGGDGSPNPGGILSCYKNSSYAWAEGTSMATPYVSGVAALVASLYPDRSNDELMRLIEETVDDIGSTGKDDYFGYGRINASGAVTASIVNEEESDSDASYTGSWAAASSGYASDGAYRYSGEVGDSVTYTFNGTGITWVADQSPESGIASVEIDGDYNEDVDLYSATSDYQSLVFAKHGLAPGTHTITITVTGNKNGNSAGTTVNVDAFDVDSSSDVTPPEDTTPPSVSISSPANNSTINNATPVLSHAVDEEVSQITVTVDNVEVSTRNGEALSQLSDGSHTVVVTANDLAGNQGSITSTFVVDALAPTVLISDPENGATGVAVNKTITIIFSKPVQAGTAYNSITFKKASGSKVSFTKSISGNTITLRSKRNLSTNTKYNIVIPVGAVKDLAGNNLSSQFALSFTTAGGN